MQKVIDTNSTIGYPYMVSNDYSNHVQQYDVRVGIMNVRVHLLNKVVDSSDYRVYNDPSIHNRTNDMPNIENRLQAIQSLSNAVAQLSSEDFKSWGLCRTIGEIQAALVHLNIDSLSTDDSPLQVAKSTCPTLFKKEA